MQKLKAAFIKVITYFKESRDELKKVVWPNRQELIRHTVIVICVSLATAAFLGVFDFVFSKILERIV